MTHVQGFFRKRLSKENFLVCHYLYCMLCNSVREELTKHPNVSVNGSNL